MVTLSQTKTSVLDTYEQRNDDWSYGDFENSLEQAMGSSKYGNYQTAKMTIIEADKAGRWPKTVKQYLLTNFLSYGNVSFELNDIFNRIYAAQLSQQERQQVDDKLKEGF